MSSDTDSLRTPAHRRFRLAEAERLFITPGIAALGPAAVKRLVQTITTFDDFYRATDPGNRPDRGVFEFDGVEVCFRIGITNQAAFELEKSQVTCVRLIALTMANEDKADLIQL